MTDETQDVDFEPEEELGAEASLKAKLAKLREELQSARKERQEYLEGWQRCKADMVNALREKDAAISTARAAGRDTLAVELIPALDAFDMARSSPSWTSVDAAWRDGIEYIRSQILSTLKSNGITPFGEAGEPFDPSRHEIAGDEQGEPGVVVRVVRPGYASGTRILRPAHIIIGAES